jgi:toxin ParE1/3/4
MAQPRFEVRLTQGAEQDLEGLYDYLVEQRGADAAQALLDSLLSRVEALERFPDRGAVPAELDRLGIRSFRQLVHPPYRIVYQVTGQQVHVLLIADGRRDMQALLERRLLGL